MSNPTQVTRSRFEITQEGKTAWLEFETDGRGWMTIWHTEVPEELRGRGLAEELTTTAFQYAKEHGLRVDVVCPVAYHIVGKRREFQQLVGKR